MFFLTPAIDLKLLLLINQQWRCGLFDFVMPILSSMTALLVAMGIIFIIMTIRDGRRHVVLFLILFAGMGVTDMSTGIIKKQVNRVRPLNEIAGTYHQAHGPWQRLPADFVRTKETGRSYPSAHSSNTMCLAVLAILLWPALKKWPLILPLLVGYSRVYLGKHYPSDVLAGWLFGLVMAYAIWLVWKFGISRFLPDN